MSGRIALVSVIALAIVVGVRAQTPETRRRDPGWTAPAEAASKANPLANRPETAAGGKKLFGQRCSTCHGDDGRGGERAPDLTTADVQLQSDGALFWKISGGNTRGGMPGFSFLPELQRWQLVMHVRALAREEHASRRLAGPSASSGVHRPSLGHLDDTALALDVAADGEPDMAGPPPSPSVSAWSAVGVRSPA